MLCEREIEIQNASDRKDLDIVGTSSVVCSKMKIDQV